jgi:hypothetical protein
LEGFDAEGADGWYKRLGKSSIGVKVFKDHLTLSNAQVEFLNAQYASKSGYTSVVLACGTIKATVNGRTKSRPVIYMRHIEGHSVTEYATMLGQSKDGSLTKAEAFGFGYEQPEMEPVKDQMDTILTRLEEMGFSNQDLTDNTDNFRVDEEGRVYAIDFGQNQISDKALLKEMFKKFGHLLRYNRIPTDLMDQLDIDLLTEAI